MALSLLFPSIENELVFYVFSLQLNWIIFLFGFYLINKEMKIPNTANILFLFFFGSINSYRNHNFNKLKKDYKIYSSSSFLTNEQRFFYLKNSSAALHLPTSKQFKYSSPLRVYFAALCGKLPSVMFRACIQKHLL